MVSSPHKIGCTSVYVIYVGKYPPQDRVDPKEYTYCNDDRDASLSSSYVNIIGTLAKNRHSFKFVQNRSKIFW